MDKTGMYQPKQKNVIPVAGLQLVLHKIVLAGAGQYEIKKTFFSSVARVFYLLQQNVAPISGLVTALQRNVGGIVCLLLPLHRFLGTIDAQLNLLPLALKGETGRNRHIELVELGYDDTYNLYLNNQFLCMGDIEQSQLKSTRYINSTLDNSLFLKSTNSEDIFIKVYPNPFHSHIGVNFDDSGYSVKIYDMSGRIVSYKNDCFNVVMLESETLKKGIYS